MSSWTLHLKKQRRQLPPVIFIGGAISSLSIARSLGAQGVKVYALCGPYPVGYSRFCERIPLRDETNLTETLTRYLIGTESDHLRGAVLLAVSDTGIEIIANHREILSNKFRLDISDSEAQLAMLDKLATYNLAVKAGVDTPRFWSVRAREDLFSVREELVFPLLVKPRKSHLFRAAFPGAKYFLANDFSHLIKLYEKVTQAGIDVMLVEFIPGPDDRLCSYYTYIAENEEEAFHFTKRIIRRYPINMGPGSYHVTDWNPEVMQLALKFFKAVGLRGLANVEFKRDERDGRLKLIECNARFTDANALLIESGFDLALFIYYGLVGMPYRLPEKYETDKRLWFPVQDFLAFRELRKRKELTFLQWLRSISHRQNFTYFKWYDPWPPIIASLLKIGQIFVGRFNLTKVQICSRLNFLTRKQQ